ncbi:hypothetical protein NDU88_007790 [Pleurodeles waltl]|uniref:Uncharacterized protein n=1 Tax=Pleurodeles waltl TaxID=8319 RepID=A0AAV7STD2_PLEWA|nr:hypothetical protein NDU88_007790 [Pleurodeles waltl]
MPPPYGSRRHPLSRRRHSRASQLLVRPSAASSMLPISWRDRERLRPLQARGLLSFPHCGHAAEAPASTCATLGCGLGPKRLAGRAHPQATGLSAGSESRPRGAYLRARRPGVFVRWQPGP